MKSKNRIPIYILLFLALFISIAISVHLGAEKIPMETINQSLFKGFSEKSGHIDTIVWKIRIPRLLLAALVGAALSLAGAAFQGVLRNPLADPYIVGTSAGAALGGVVAIILNIRENIIGISAISVLSFTGSLVAMYVVYMISKQNGRIPVEKFILAGVIVGSFLWAIVSFMLTLARQSLHEVIFWLMGSTQAANWQNVSILVAYLFPSLIFLMVLAYPLNILTLGDNSAQHLGVKPGKTRLWIIILASLVTSAAVSVSGMIGFVGLMIPHTCRYITGADHRVLLPVSTLTGAIFLIWIDNAARMITAPSEIPVGILTAILGAPFFLFLLKRKKGIGI